MVKAVLPNFNKGEISPELFGRVDVSAYQGGLATARNAVVHTYGGISRRPGLRYLAPVKDHSTTPRLVRFEFKTTDDYILEFGDLYMRVIRDDGHVLDTASLISIIDATNASPIVITTSDPHGYSDGDEVFIDNVQGMTELNQKRFVIANVTTTTFELTNQITGANINGVNYHTYTFSGTVYKIYEIATPYLVEDVYELDFSQSADTMTICHTDYAPRELVRTDHDAWTLSVITFAPDTATVTGAAFTITNAGTDTYKYYITAVDATTFEEGLPGTIQHTTVNATNPSNSISWNAVTNADRYRIYLSINSAYPAFLTETTTNAYVDKSTAELDSTRTPPTSRNPFNAVGDYPACGAYYQQRKVFGGTANKPDTSEFSKVGAFHNFTRSVVLQDDDAISATLASTQVNEIRHYIPLQDLITLTSGAEWTIDSGYADSFTPNSITQRIHSKWGCSKITPEVIGSTVIFLAENESDVRTFEYSVEIKSYAGTNLNILSRHLLEGFTVTDMASIRYPDSRVYMTRSDGTGLALTFDEEQKTIAWTTLDTDGSFLGVESLHGGGTFGEDSVYWIVERTVNGISAKFIEVMRQTFFSDVADCFFVDSGISYDSTPVSSVSGLDHLEGRNVSILADGNIISNLSVLNGTITLPQAFSKIHVGIPYTTEIKTLNLDTGNGSIQGDMKRITKVVVRFFKSRGMFIGPDEDNLTEMKQREDEAYDEATGLLTGDKQIYIAPSWNTRGQLLIRNSYPLPMTILAVIPWFITENSKDE